MHQHSYSRDTEPEGIKQFNFRKLNLREFRSVEVTLRLEV